MSVPSKSLSLLFVALILSAGVQADDEAAIRKTIESMQVFEYGQSTQNQIELERWIKKTHNDPVLRGLLERGILDALKSETTSLAAQSFFCKKLSRIGSEDALPVLGDMLLQDETTQMACYALKTNPSPHANQILRQALDKVQGTSRVAVINLLGERRDPESVEALHELVSPEKGVVSTFESSSL